MSNRVNPMGGCLVLVGLAVIAGVNIVSGGRFFDVVWVGLGAFVLYRVVRRRRAVANGDSIAPGEAHLLASSPGASQSALHGRLHGLRDGKQALRMTAGKTSGTTYFFTIRAGTDQRWIRGYREGMAEVIPSAVVEVAYTPQKGSTIL